jgi:fucose permease
LNSKPQSTPPALIVLTYLGFISIGLPDGLLGVAWPTMRHAFGAPIDALGGLLVMFTLGYLTSSFQSGRLLARMNVGVMLALSCATTGASLLGYATAGVWWIVLAAGLTAGLGAGAIDAGLNTFAATHFSVRNVNLLHAFFGVGASCGPLLMTSMITRGPGWRWGYGIVGLGQLALAGAFMLTRRRWDGGTTSLEPGEQAPKPGYIATLRLPVVRWSMLVFFLYVGVEASAGAWAYSLFTEARGVSPTIAGSMVSLYWGSLTAGRVLAALIGFRVRPSRLLRGCIAMVVVGAALLWLNFSKELSFFGLAVMGFAFAPMFPSLIASTPQRLESDYVAHAMGFQIAASVLGYSLTPAGVGVLAKLRGLEMIPICLFALVLFLFGAFEALNASSRSRETAQARDENALLK